MDIINELSKRVDIKEKQIDASDFFADSSFLLAGEIPPGRKTKDFLESSTGWVNACVNAISDELALIKIRLFKYNKDGVEEIENHKILDLLNRANNFTTKFDLFWLTGNYLELAGEAPWFIVYEAGLPVQIILLRPDRLKVIPGENINEIIKGYKYNAGNNKMIPLDFNEIVFLRYPDPAKPFRGQGTLKATARTVDIDDFSEEWNKNFYFNSARPDAILATEQKLTKIQVENLEKKLKKFKSYKNAHKMMVLQSGLKYEPMALSQKDMDFMKQQEFGRDKILGIFRVPKTILGITEKVSVSNAQATDVIFAKRTIKPKMQRIVEQLNEFLVPLFPNLDNHFLSYDDPVPENVELELKKRESYLNTGYGTINEVRKEAGLPDIGDEGNKIRIPNNLINIDGIKSENNDNKSHSTFIKQMIARNRKKIEKEKIKKKAKTLIQKTIEDKLKKILKSQVIGKNKKVNEEEEIKISNEERKKLEFQDRQLEIADKFEIRFLTQVRKVFNDQEKRILADLSKKAIDPKEFRFDPNKEAKLYSRSVESVVLDIIRDESNEAFNFLEIDQSLDLGNKAIENYVNITTLRFGREVTKTTNKQIENVIRKGVKEGESVPQISKRITTLFNSISTGRAVRITRSETIRAANFATERAYIESEVVSHKEWLTSLDDRVCQWCMPMNQRVVALGKAYHKYNDKFQGVQGGVLKFNYTEIQYPPLHANCRCTIIPIVVRSAVSSKIKNLKKENKDLSKTNKTINKIINE